MASKRVAIYSEKGGVGKTALTVGMAAVAADRGLKVLVIDLDPRATATDELGITDPAWTVNDLLYVDPEADPVSPRGLAADAILTPGEPWPAGLDLLAAERALGRREADPTAHMESRLALSLEGVADRYDLVLMDVPPRAGGKLVAAALTAATSVLVPLTLDDDGRIGAADAQRSVERHAVTAGQDLAVRGVVRNIVEGTVTNLATEINRWAVETYGPLLLRTRIPRYNVRRETRFAHVPITAANTVNSRALVSAYGDVLDTLLGGDA